MRIGPMLRRRASHPTRRGARALASIALLVPVATAIGCTLDSDCTASQWCSQSSGMCVSKIFNGGSLPIDPGHVPTLDGQCRTSAASAVCVSAVCDVQNNTCGFLNGDGPCTNANGAVVCDSGYCSPTLLVCESGPNRFSIVAADQRVNQGGNATITVSTAVTSGLAESVDLSASGFPAGVSGQFNPVSVTAGDSSTLTVSADPNAVPGVTTQITVSGSALSDNESTTFNLTVWDYLFRDGFE